MRSDPFHCLREFEPTPGKQGRYYALSALEKAGLGRISRLPVSIRVVLEALVRHCDGAVVTEESVRALAGWQPNASRTTEIPFNVARIVMPDSSGIALLVDIAAMRDAAQKLGRDARVVEPRVDVDLIVDHSVQVDFAGTDDALQRNMKLEVERNGERFRFAKWATQAFDAMRVVPPGFGIIHQVNNEYLSPGVQERDGVYFPDTVLGADSHTPMINGIGVVGWGAGGIEVEAGILGQPVYFLTPDVVGVELTNRLRPGVTSTDAALAIVQTLRQAKVVNKFVEFFGDGAAALSATDRATIANMSPETGATIGFFPVDEQTAEYYRSVGRSPEQVAAFRAYYQAQSLWGMPRAGDLDYSSVLEIDLAKVVPSVAGPGRPQDRIPVAELRQAVGAMLQKPVAQGGYGRPAPATGRTADGELRDGSVVLAAIASCTNTSNPRGMLTAGLLAKKAVERGLKPAPWVKTSLSPGSRVVTAYLEAAGLQRYFDQLGYQTVGYGCLTCIGNSGPLDPAVEKTVVEKNLVVAAVLSGNRNFEARIHPAIKANFLASPALVLAFAIAGRIDIDMDQEPLGSDAQGRPVTLAEIWPRSEEVDALIHYATDPAVFQRVYAGARGGTELWRALPQPSGPLYAWEADSTYFKLPPFFDGFTLQPKPPAAITGARALAILGNSITTDHIAPVGAIKPTSPAGLYLQQHGVPVADFNSYNARRGNHEVMMRGAFANVRIRNLMVPGVEGGVTVHQPDGQRMAIYDAAMLYAREQVPLVVIAGQEYGTGSSRDSAGKGTMLLGVRAVIAKSFERIHRNNLIGMGVLPVQFVDGMGAQELSLDGSETYDIVGIGDAVQPGQRATLSIHGSKGTRDVPVLLRIDTPVEVEYYKHGGILPYVLRDLLGPGA
jgi:aconitate hydratase